MCQIIVSLDALTITHSLTLRYFNQPKLLLNYSKEETKKRNYFTANYFKSNQLYLNKTIKIIKREETKSKDKNKKDIIRWSVE